MIKNRVISSNSELELVVLYILEQSTYILEHSAYILDYFWTFLKILQIIFSESVNQQLSGMRHGKIKNESKQIGFFFRIPKSDIRTGVPGSLSAARLGMLIISALPAAVYPRKGHHGPLSPRWPCNKGGLAVVRPRRASSIRQTTLVNHGRVRNGV